MPNTKPESLFYFLSFSQGFLFWNIVTVVLVYHATTVGMNPLQMVLVGTVLEATIFLAEVPTGVVADSYSRKGSMVIGFLLMGSGFVLEGSIAQFSVVLMAQVVWGIGHTFVSGASHAWVADEMAHVRGGPQNMESVFLRGTQLEQIGSIPGIGAAVILGSMDIRFPILFSGVMFALLGIFVLMVMPEKGFVRVKRAQQTAIRSATETAHMGLRLIGRKPLLIVLLVVTAVFGMFNEGYDRLWTPHLLENFQFPFASSQTVLWFGFINLGTVLLTLLVSELVRRKLTGLKDKHRFRLLRLIYGAMIASIILVATARSFPVVLLAIWVTASLRTVVVPLVAAWVNHLAESSVRATVLSMNSQADALGQVGGGPLIGWVGNTYSLRAALTLSGFVLLPALAFLSRKNPKSKPTPMV